MAARGPSPVPGRDDEGLPAVGFLTAVEEVKRLGDPPRGLMISHGDRLLVEPCLRIRRRVFAIEDRDPAEVLARGPIVVHIPLSEHRDPRGRGHQTVRQIPGIVRRAGVDAPRTDVQSGSETGTGAFVEGPVADDGLGRSVATAMAACMIVAQAAPPP